MASKELEKLMTELKNHTTTKKMPVLTRAKSFNSNQTKKIGVPTIGTRTEGEDEDRRDENGIYDNSEEAEVRRDGVIVNHEVPGSGNHHSGAHHSTPNPGPPNGVNPFTRRNKRAPKHFDPSKQYMPDYESRLLDFQGGELPTYNPHNLKRHSDGRWNFEATDHATLVIIVRRMISMYLSNKKKLTSQIINDSKMIGLLTRIKKSNEEEIMQLCRMTNRLPVFHTLK